MMGRILVVWRICLGEFVDALEVLYTSIERCVLCILFGVGGGMISIDLWWP